MKIYVETEMTEMPKNCMKYGNKGQRCFNYQACRASHEHVDLPKRPEWCPLHKGELKEEQ